MVTIYRLRCVYNDKAYIGCTAGKLGKRMREHRCLLNGKKHASAELQRLWNEHGPKGFRMEPVETLPKGVSVIEKRKRELFWLEKYDKDGMLLNHSKCSFAPPKHAPALAAKARVKNGYRPSAESNEKRRLALLGRTHNHGHKISATKRRRFKRRALEKQGMR